MAHQSENSVESIAVRIPPSLAPTSSSSSSSSSSQPESAAKCYVNALDFSRRHFLIQNESNFKRSASPARLMSYRNGSWLDFPSEVVDSVKSRFLERKPIADVKIKGSNYVLDFLRMIQIDYDTGKQRSIAWIDVTGHCFFPKMFLGEEEDENNSTKIEMEININKRQREAVEKDVEVSSKRQRLVVANSRKAKWLNTRLTKETEKLSTHLRDGFLFGIKKIDAGATLTSMHQCTRVGHLERARFEVFQKQIEVTKAARGETKTVYAWYGASARDVDVIMTHGFGVPSKITTHGVGVYLSAIGFPCLSAKLAEADENGEKHVILCRVILGNVEQVEAGSQQCYPSSVDFDSGSDDPKNPKWYIVWPCNMNRHILPECVVSYKPSSHSQGELIEKFLWKMKSSLSPAKLREMMNLFHTFKARKLARDEFIKQLQELVGHGMLTSTLREISASV